MLAKAIDPTQDLLLQVLRRRKRHVWEMVWEATIIRSIDYDSDGDECVMVGVVEPMARFDATALENMTNTGLCSGNLYETARRH